MGRLDAFSVLSRRRLLKFGLGAGGAVVLGGGSLFTLRGAAPAVDGLRTLSAHEYRTLTKLAEVVVPGSEALDLGRTFDGFLADEPPWNIDDLKRALFLLELGPVFFDLRVTTFSNLSAADRLAHFRSWQTSGTELRRVVSNAFRRFLLLVFYDQPSSWAQIGYEGPLIK